MRAAIAGGHGRSPCSSPRLLSERGDDMVGLLRNPGPTAEVQAGAGSGPQRRWTMDRDGAVKLLQASPTGIRYVMISAVGAEDPPDGDDVFSVYPRAKTEADGAVMASDARWTILRPGRLTDDPGTGRVGLETTPFRGEVPRADVAAVLAAVLHGPGGTGQVLHLNGGEVPVEQALVAVG